MNEGDTILRIRTKEGTILRITLPCEIYRRMLIDSPHGIPPLFLRNLVTLASNRSARSIDKADGRGTHFYRRLYRRGFPLNKLLPLVAKTLDKKDFEAVTRSLVREMNNKKKAENGPDIVDVAICYLDDAGTLVDCIASEGADRVTSFLQKKLGVPYKLEPDTYRKRVERLRGRGVKLGSDK
jgi:hypothetical protein